VARYLDVDVRHVEKMSQRGQLPGEMVDGRLRFNRIHFIEWLQNNMTRMEPRMLTGIEDALANILDEPVHFQGTHGVVTSLLHPGCISISLPARTKSSAIRELIALAERADLVWDRDVLIQSVEKREALCATALPGGLAIPHPQQPLPYATSEPFLCFGRVPGGIGFGAVDGGMTSLFFLICCHEHAHHLKVLARLMRLLDANTRSALTTVCHEDDVRDLLAAREDTINAGGH
jgi:PTS system nitrogen regulatory IIA component